MVSKCLCFIVHRMQRELDWRLWECNTSNKDLKDSKMINIYTTKVQDTRPNRAKKEYWRNQEKGSQLVHWWHTMRFDAHRTTYTESTANQDLRQRMDWTVRCTPDSHPTVSNGYSPMVKWHGGTSYSLVAHLTDYSADSAQRLAHMEDRTGPDGPVCTGRSSAPTDKKVCSASID
jgi:hypothetical protein